MVGEGLAGGNLLVGVEKRGQRTFFLSTQQPARGGRRCISFKWMQLTNVGGWEGGGGMEAEGKRGKK